MYCRNCGRELPDGSNFCDRCGNSQGYASGGIGNSQVASMMMNKKSSGLALVLSFFLPGLGQLYNGRISKGIIFIVAVVVIAAVGSVLAASGAVLLGIIASLLYPVVWIYGMYDAYRDAKEYNAYMLNHSGNTPWRCGFPKHRSTRKVARVTEYNRRRAGGPTAQNHLSGRHCSGDFKVSGDCVVSESRMR